MIRGQLTECFAKVADKVAFIGLESNVRYQVVSQVTPNGESP